MPKSRISILFGIKIDNYDNKDELDSIDIDRLVYSEVCGELIVGIKILTSDSVSFDEISPSDLYYAINKFESVEQELYQTLNCDAVVPQIHVIAVDSI